MEKVSKARHLELLQQARRFFAMRSMLKTPQLIENLISDLENNRKKDYNDAFIQIEEAYSDEIRKKGEYQYSCYQAIKKIFVDAIGAGIRPLLEDVFPIANDWFEANKNIQRISEVYQQDMRDEPRVLLYCFVYLIYCEGGYKSWMRILLYILCRTRGESISIDELSEKPLRTIKEMMNKRGVDPILFQGYLNGEVRMNRPRAFILE